jgi:hypothetical protein
MLFGFIKHEFSTANHAKAPTYIEKRMRIKTHHRDKTTYSVAINIYNFILYNHPTRYKLLLHYLPLSLLHTSQRGVATIFKRLPNSKRELVGGLASTSKKTLLVFLFVGPLTLAERGPH